MTGARRLVNATVRPLSSPSTLSVLARFRSRTRCIRVGAKHGQASLALRPSQGALSGTILNSTIRTDVPKRVDITASAAVDLVRKPSEIQALPAGTRSAVIDAVATGVGRVFLLGAVLYAIGVYWAWTTPELPLRRVASVSQTMAAEAG